MFRTKDLTIIAVFSAILFVQELSLSFIPNIQLTVFLLVLYSKVFGLKKTCIIKKIWKELGKGCFCECVSSAACVCKGGEL